MMKILFVASEVDPILKVGGIADVVGSLSKRIKELGAEVRIIIPFYQPLKEKLKGSLTQLTSFKVWADQEEEEVVVWETQFLSGSEKIKLYLISHPEYLSAKDIYLDVKDFAHLKRFLFFNQAVMGFLENFSWQPEIVHCHDWQAGILPLLIKKKKLNIKSFFTIHNLLIQGQWNYDSTLKFLGLSEQDYPSLKYKKTGPYGENFNVLQQAILNADLISVVSPNYAQEIKTKKYYARGLEKVIKKREKDIHGILNGIDIKTFNPQTDKNIVQNYSFKDIFLKNENKIFLQKSLKLKPDSEIPLLTMVSRLDVQKGVDLICQATENLITKNIQFIFLGTGERKHEKMLKGLSERYPEKVKALIKFDSKLAQQIYAGGDMFLMPSKFEPCGLSQLIAMRYGNIPIARATGGLVNTVENIREEKKLFGLKKKIKGTGFVFDGFSPEKFTQTIKRALCFYDHKKQWKKIQENAMQKDFSWKNSAENYLKLYKKLLNQ